CYAVGFKGGHTMTNNQLVLNQGISAHTFVVWMQVLGASLLLALCANIYIPLYFTPVPLTMQTFAIMLIGATLGSRKAAASVCLYLTQGLLGLPVFAGAIMGYDIGYLAGFVLQAYMVGWAVERMKACDPNKMMSLLLLSCALQLGIGALWLSAYVGLAN